MDRDIVQDQVHVSIDELLAGISLSRYDFHHSIPRVPDALREVNSQCYTPRLISIGPLHHGNPRLRHMEELKLQFLKNFPADHHKIIDFILENEQAIRRHYQEKIMLNSKDFSQMILLDSVFIIQLFIQKEEGNPMFVDNLWFSDLVHDMLLIENQVPLQIPWSIFYKFYHEHHGSRHESFCNLAKGFFKDLKMASVQLPTIVECKEGDPRPLEERELPRHFIEYLRMAHLPHDKNFNPASPLPKKRNYGITTTSRLLEYGVKFEIARENRLVQIEFDSHTGILAIPQVKINEWTETLFRNLLAFEQSGHLKPRFVSDYIIFMDSLIDTPGDVMILTHAGIIQDDFQDPEKVSKLFNNLYKEAITEDKDFCFTRQSIELNKYRRNWWHKWKATWYNWKLILKRDYFNSPWATVSFIAAVILLGLTIVQTVCSVYQAKGVKM